MSGLASGPPDAARPRSRTRAPANGTPRGHVLVAADKFKGSLTATDVVGAVAAGIRSVVPDADLRLLPVADGGEGTVAAAVAAGFARVDVPARGPTGRSITASFALQGDTAIVELAEASGLHRLPDGPAPLVADTAGTGDVIAAAVRAGARRVVLGVGGSASTDGGAGLLSALGARLRDRQGAPLPPGGAALRDLGSVDLSTLDPVLAGVTFELACDVDNPLLGPHGAAAVYAPQKGARPAAVRILEDGLRRWASVIGSSCADRPGAGAAGGAGFAALAVLGATMRPGIALLGELLGLDAAVRGARLVVTGEGSLDGQTLRGKAPAGIAARARAASVPVVAVAGRCSLGGRQLRAAGFDAVYPLTDLEPDPARCMTNAEGLLTAVAARLAQQWLVAVA